MLPVDRHPDAFESLRENLEDDFYFPYLWDVARRAFELLPDKNYLEVSMCAVLNEVRIESKMRDLDHERYLRETASGVDDNELVEYPLNSQTVSEQRALKLFFEDQWVDLKHEPIIVVVLNISESPFAEDPRFFQHEVFAVLALTKLLETVYAFEAPLIEIMSTEVDPEAVTEYFAAYAEMTDLEREALLFQENLRIAAKHAMLALEAVNYAERKKLEHDFRMLDIEKKEVQVRSLLENRHREGNQIIDETLAEWETRRLKGMPVNADANGIELADWLESERSVKRAPRVVAGWIRNHAKKIGLKFR